jgi:nuclear transport factor 2 (NTF2) superfamily protein
MASRPPLPPFTIETATKKVRMAEDAWNTREPDRIAQAYTVDSEWRNRIEFLKGHNQIVEFLQRKWARELDYRLVKEAWTFANNKIAIRFAYEWQDDSRTVVADWLYGELKKKPQAVCENCVDAS